MTAEIRSATPLDADAIAAVHVAAWRAAYRDTLTVEVLARVTVEARAAQWRERLGRAGTRAADPASPRTWLARNGGQVVAFASTGPSRDDDVARCAELYAVYVVPSRWGQGIGRALFEHCLEHAHASNSRAFILWVVESNARARAFYEARGMATDGRKMMKPAFGAELPEVRYRLELGKHV